MSNIRRYVYKRRAIAYKGGKCELCGYDKCERALTFHHRNPEEKSFSISGGHCRSWKSFCAEVDKCDLLCMNCHMEVHEQLDKEEHLYQERARLPNKECLTCGKLFHARRVDAKYCSTQCSGKAARKVERPSKHNLALLMTVNGWSQLGRMFDVSGNAVKKWAVSYGLGTRAGSSVVRAGSL